MGRVEEIFLEGKNIVYVDCSGLTSDKAFLDVIAEARPIIDKYTAQSVYTITNIANIKFDTNTKEITAKYSRDNAPYVIYGVVVGIDGIKKMMGLAVMKLSGRTNITFAFTKEQAIEWILKHE